MKNIRKRGSVLIFCVVLMASVSTILMSTADVGQFTTLRQYRTEDDVRFDYTENSIRAIYAQQALENSLILPSNETLTINGFNVSVRAEAGTGARIRMVELDTTMAGRTATRRRQLCIGRRGPVSPMWFAFGSDSTFSPVGNVQINGDAYFGGDHISTGKTILVTEDLYGNAKTLTNPVTVEGTTNLGRRLVSPSLDADLYMSAASQKTSGNQDCNLLDFLPDGAYETLWFHSGDITFDVNYTGRGTVYVRGNAIIKHFSRTLPKDQGLIIVDGNVEFQTNRFEGFLICNGLVRQTKGGNFLSQGTIWANSFDFGNGKLMVDFDPFFWDNPDFDKRMRVPGMW